MELVLKSLPFIEKLGLGALIAIVLGLIIWKLFEIIEKKDNRMDAVVDTFRKDIQKTNESRGRDADQITKAVEHLTEIVKVINNGKNH